MHFWLYALSHYFFPQVHMKSDILRIVQVMEAESCV